MKRSIATAANTAAKKGLMYTLKSTASLLAIALASTAIASGSQQAAGVGSADGNAKSKRGEFTSLPAKKSGSGVEIAYLIEGTPDVGRALSISLNVSSSADAQIALRAGDGIVLNYPLEPFQSLAGQTTLHQVTVTPTAQGRVYLHIVSSANGRGTASSIAIQVGKEAIQSKPSGNVKVMPNGERVISVPAR